MSHPDANAPYLTGPAPTDPAVIAHQRAAVEHSFSLAAALAELALLVTDEQRTSARALNTAAAVCLSDARLAL